MIAAGLYLLDMNFSELAKEIAKMWKELSDEDKSV